jgi:UDP-N-acetylmuramate--alanine ligase
VITFGMNDEADVRGMDVRHIDGREQFSVSFSDKSVSEQFILNLPGEHNVLNALAAIAVARELGISIEAIRAALSEFQGIARRCQVHRAVNIGDCVVTLIDDYGHHPNEIGAVLETIRRGWPGNRLILVFQPHRYSRTRDLFEDFVNVLSRADVLLLLEVYAAGEPAIPGVDGRALCRAIRTRGLVDPIFVDEIGSIAQVLADVVRDDDIVAMLGAGNIGGVAEAIVA